MALLSIRRRLQSVIATADHAQSLTGQRAFPKKISVAQDADRRFLARLGHDGQSDFALLNVEDRVGRISLGEDPLLLGDGQALPALSNGCEESAGIELTVLSGRNCHF